MLSIPKNKIKRIFNIGKVTFYISKVLNAHISRQNFYFNMFNHYPEGTVYHFPNNNNNNSFKYLVKHNKRQILSNCSSLGLNVTLLKLEEFF
jgi:hypothetical protein